jgi:hypothetical protein
MRIVRKENWAYPGEGKQVLPHRQEQKDLLPPQTELYTEMTGLREVGKCLYTYFIHSIFPILDS